MQFGKGLHWGITRTGTPGRYPKGVPAHESGRVIEDALTSKWPRTRDTVVAMRH
jgi:hypothetical protein